MLQVNDLHAYYGKSHILQGVSVDVKEGEIVSLRSGGGGGWGDPLDRDPEWVLHDVCDDVVSVAAAHDVYGIVLDAANTSVDAPRTEAQRRALRKARSVELVD